MPATRRAVLGAAAGATGLLAAARLLGTFPRPADETPVRTTGAAPQRTPDGPPAPVALLGDDPLHHLVRRVAPAPSLRLVDEVVAAGRDAWLEAQLAPTAEAELPRALATALSQLAIETMDVEEYVAAQRAARPEPDEPRRPDVLPPQVELAVSLLLRRTMGPWPLQEALVELWGDLLHVHIGHDAATRVLTPFLVRDVLRPLALGRFDDLLVGVTTSPAMLRYLDGAGSRAGAVNENHARELLELHTVGVGAHDEQDVAATARVLTGWVLQPRRGEARLVARLHDDAPVRVLDWQGSGGTQDVEDLLRHLAHHPATAERVARAIAVRFVADDPDPGLVEDLAATYLAADTAIAPVVRQLLDSDAFAASIGDKLRRPMEFVTAALGGLAPDPATGLRRGAVRTIGEGLAGLGHTPHGWPAPDGYPDVAPAWVSSAAAIGRWSLATELAAATTEVPSADPAATVDDLATRMLLAPLDHVVRERLVTAAGDATDPARAAMALVLDLPAAHLR